MAYGGSAMKPKVSKSAKTPEEKLKEKFKEHAKNHSAKHIREMKKLMKQGMSFTKAHNKVMKEMGK